MKLFNLNATFIFDIGITAETKEEAIERLKNTIDNNELTELCSHNATKIIISEVTEKCKNKNGMIM